MSELGHILFAASSTLPGLNSLIEQIQKEEEELFKKGGRKSKLNEALLRYNDIDKTYKQQIRAGKDGKTEKTIIELQEKYNKHECEIEALRIDLKRLERIKFTKPIICSLDKIVEELTLLGPH